jgi:hypothetical protein
MLGKLKNRLSKLPRYLRRESPPPKDPHTYKMAPVVRGPKNCRGAVALEEPDAENGPRTTRQELTSAPTGLVDPLFGCRGSEGTPEHSPDGHVLPALYSAAGFATVICMVLRSFSESSTTCGSDLREPRSADIGVLAVTRYFPGARLGMRKWPAWSVVRLRE